MKLLIVGSNKIYAIENFYVKYLKEKGIDVLHFPAQSIFYDYYQASFLNKVFFKAGLSRIYNFINLKLRELVKIEVPDIVWIFKGMEIYPETVKWIQAQKIKVINYNPDNPFIFSGKGSGNENITGTVGLYDLHFTYNLEIKSRLESYFNKSAVWLPFGYDIDPNFTFEITEQREIIKTCFLGNPDRDRATFILALAEKGISIDVYGNDWNKFLAHENIKFHQPVYGSDQWTTLQKYRVQLNLMRVHNDDSHNMRTFEVPGVGGIMVGKDTVEHRMFFEHGREAFFFDNAESCATLISTILQLPFVEARKIRAAAINRSEESGYSYKARSQKVFETLQHL